MSLALLPLLAALVAAGLLFGLFAFVGRRSTTVSRRAQALSMSRGWSGAPTSAPVAIARSGGNRLDKLSQRLLPQPAQLRQRLEATGLPLTLGHYGAATLGAAGVTALLLLMAGASLAAALFAGMTAGFLIPHLTVGIIAGRRKARFLKLFTDAISLIVRGLRAGLPVTETIGVVGREVAAPVGEEFRRVADQVRLGRPLEQALQQAAQRLNLPEFNFLVISLSVQRETGGNLAETLENLGHILRSRHQMRLKIKAMSSEATASALIIGSLPFVMALLMFLFSRDYLAVLFTNPLGQIMLAGGMVSLLAGAVIMRQMVRFEI
jgi:tight adherence protein B